MITKKFLIQCSYGFDGYFQGHYHSIHCNGLNFWILTYDNTIEGLRTAFLEAQENSTIVKEFNKAAQLEGLPVNFGRWLLFSVLAIEDVLE